MNMEQKAEPVTNLVRVTCRLQLVLIKYYTDVVQYLAR
jgi:hypothetical protein